MSAKVRCFFALPVREDDKPTLIETIARMRAAAEGSRLRPRFIVSEQLHVTVKFLGFVEPDTIDELKAIGTRYAASFGAFALEWTGVIAFGGRRRARALVAEIAGDASELVRLATSIDADAEALGIERETRSFRPHVTLARLKQPGDARRLLEAANLEPARVQFPELVLYRSVQTPNGGVYSVIDRWSLGA